MAFAGLKKQINKANQYMTEKIGGAEGTKLDLDIMDMERKTDVTAELVEDLQTKTKEFLQPNPTARAKMAAVKGISKLSGQAKSNTYPQSEGVLGECMLTYGKRLGDDSAFGTALIEFGEALKQMADVKYSLDDSIKQNFLEPLHQLQTKDIKEVMHHRKKLQGRRLDFDCKRRRQAKDDEIRQAEEKFAESLQLAQLGMFNLLENDVEQVAQLATFADALVEYHQQCHDILRMLAENLNERRDEAVGRPKQEFIPKTLSDLHVEPVHHDGLNGASNFSVRTSNSQSNLQTRHNISSRSSNRTTFRSYTPASCQDAISSSHDYYSPGMTALPKPSGSNPNAATVFLVPPPPVQNGAKRLQQPLSRYPSLSNNSTNVRSNNNVVRSSSSSKIYKSNSEISRNETDPFAAIDPWDDVLTRQFNAGSSRASSPVNKPSQLDIFGSGGQDARSTNASPLPSPMSTPARTPMVNNAAPCCKALYDFEPENPGELGFKENDVITLINKIDENWFEGSVNGRTGYFPVAYVQVVVPLP